MLHILAQRDSNGIADVLLWLVPIVVWVIGSIAAAMNKKKEQDRRKRVRDQINPMPPPAPQLPPMPSSQHRGQRPSPPPIPPSRTQAQRNAKRFAHKVPLPPPRIETVIESDESARPARAARPAPSPQPARPQPAPVSARVIHQWLTPATLRQQFILTELLQPPVALREPRETDGKW